MEMDDELDGLSIDENADEFPISIDRVSYQYPSANYKTIKDLSLNIPAKTSVVISGLASSGKSTLLYLMSGIIEPLQGLIKFRGLPIKSLNKRQLRNFIGFSLSNNEIFQGTILENIKMGREEISSNDIIDALAITRLDDFISSVPLGLKTIIDPEGQRIPRNISNRILLARAIANKPKLLILEDPLDHVAKEEKAMIQKDLTSPHQPWTIIISSVDSSWTKFISDEVILSEGSIHSTTLNL